MHKNEVNCTKKVEIDLEEECCGICRFHAEEGECRRHAPRGGTFDVGYNGHITYDKWARTEDFEWCGEFEKEVL